MNLAMLSRLVAILRESPELGAIEVRRGLFGLWTSIRVSKAGHANAGGGGVPAAPPAPPAVGGGGGGGGAAMAAGAVVEARLVEIKSPMVGTFYKAPEPGAAPYVKVGSRVSGGQVVCIIEAMKIMNEIESDVAGVVREVCVDNGQPVEFGQVLFRVDPHG